MQNKPKIVFSMASAGMGHATRAVPVIQRLQDEYEVHIFCSGKANQWLGKQFPHLHQNHAIKGVTSGGKVNITLVFLKAMLELPKSLFYIFRIAFFILKNRPVAVVSDFEAHAAYAGKLVRPLYKIPIISCDHWAGLLLSKRPFTFTPEEEKELQKWEKTIGMVTKHADYYLVHGGLKTELSIPNAKYVPNPIRDKFLEAGKNPSTDGPVVVSLGHLTPPSLSQELNQIPGNFVIYGSDNPRVEGNVEYKAFNEEEFIKALASAPYLIVAANSSALDGLAVKKALFYVPNPGQFEQLFCGKIFEHLGVAKLCREITKDNIDDFLKDLPRYQENAQKADLFGNDLVVSELKKAIKENQFAT